MSPCRCPDVTWGTYHGEESRVQDIEYQLELVDDDALPADCDWAFAIGAGLIVLFLKRRAAGRSCVLAEAWAAFRSIGDRRSAA